LYSTKILFEDRVGASVRSCPGWGGIAPVLLLARGIDAPDANLWIVNSPTSQLADWTARGSWTSQVMDQSPHRLVKSRMTPLTETFWHYFLLIFFHCQQNINHFIRRRQRSKIYIANV